MLLRRVLPHLERTRLLAASLLALATLSAGTAHAEPVAIVPASEADLPLVQYLARALPDAAIRRDLAGLSLVDARARTAGGAVLSVDVRRGLLRAMRSGSAEIFERSFERDVAERSPYALVVAVAELLALPSVPAPPLDDGGTTARDDAGGAARAGTADAPGAGNAGEPGGARGRVDAEGTVDAGGTDDADVAENDAGAADEVGDRGEGDGEPATEDGGDDAVADFGFQVRLAYTLFASGEPTLVLHRPSLALGVSLGTSALRGVALVSADVLGVAETTTPNGATVTVTRQDLRLALGLIVGVGALELEGGGFVGTSISHAEAVLGEAEGADDRLGVSLGGFLGAALVLGAGFRLFVQGSLGADPGANRILAGGEPAFGDGPVLVRLAAGLGWASR